MGESRFETETVCRVAHGQFGRVALIAIPGPMAPHVHHHCHVLFKAGGADAACRVGDGTWRLTDDNAILVNPWERHHLGAPGDRWPVTILALYIEPGWMGSALEAPALGWPGLGGAREMFRTPVVPLSPALARHKGELLECLAGRAPAGVDAIDEAIARVLASLASDDAFAGPVRNASLPDPRIRRAVDVIARCDGNVPELGALAREVGMSRPRFFERFRVCTGTSPTLFANHCRLERATAALEREDVSLVELSAGLGFSEQANFTRFFRKHFGVPPGIYRRGLGLRSGASAPRGI